MYERLLTTRKSILFFRLDFLDYFLGRSFQHETYTSNLPQVKKLHTSRAAKKDSHKSHNYNGGVVVFVFVFYFLPRFFFGPHETLCQILTSLYNLYPSNDQIQLIHNQNLEAYSVIQPPNILSPRNRIKNSRSQGFQFCFWGPKREGNVSESCTGRWQFRRGGRKDFFKKVRLLLQIFSLILLLKC